MSAAEVANAISDGINYLYVLATASADLDVKTLSAMRDAFLTLKAGVAGTTSDIYVEDGFIKNLNVLIDHVTSKIDYSTLQREAHIYLEYLQLKWGVHLIK